METKNGMPFLAPVMLGWGFVLMCMVLFCGSPTPRCVGVGVMVVCCWGYIWCLEGSGREAAAGRQCKGSYAQPALSRLYGQMVQTICPSIRQQKTSMSHDIEVLC